jgi:hypothetical protein
MSSEVAVKAAPVGVSNLEYAVSESNLGSFYIDYWSDSKAFQENKKYLDNQLLQLKKEIKNLKEEGKKIPSVMYKACLDCEAKLNMMNSVQRNAYKVKSDKRKLNKLARLFDARRLAYIHKEGLEIKDNDKGGRDEMAAVEGSLKNFGCDESDLVKHSDGKYHLSYEAYEKIRPMSEIVSKTKNLPPQWLVIFSIILFFGSVVLAFILKKTHGGYLAATAVVGGGIASALSLLAGILFTGVKIINEICKITVSTGSCCIICNNTRDSIIVIIIDIYVVYSPDLPHIADTGNGSCSFSGMELPYPLCVPEAISPQKNAAGLWRVQPGQSDPQDPDPG